MLSSPNSPILKQDGVDVKFPFILGVSINRSGGEIGTLYLMVLKPVNDSLAYLLDPLVLSGRGSCEHWEKATESIDHSLKKQIKPFVSDDFRASQRLAEK